MSNPFKKERCKHEWEFHLFAELTEFKFSLRSLGYVQVEYKQEHFLCKKCSASRFGNTWRKYPDGRTTVQRMRWRIALDQKFPDPKFAKVIA
jgi:hypothetical protein